MNKRDAPNPNTAFQTPIIEVDEWRERFLPDGARMLYRCIQGRYDGTNVRFNLLFPEKDNCRRRFHQCLTPASFSRTEDIGREAAVALQSGACFVENSQEPEDLWRANAAVADMTRRKAREIYGPNRFYGYVYGGRGSAYRALACVEHSFAWDGAALLMPGDGTILYDVSANAQMTLTEGARDLPRTLTALADWVERGVRPIG